MAHLQAIFDGFDDQVQTDGDPGDSDTAIGQNGKAGNRNSGGPEPTLFHKVKNQKSILALVVSDSRLYAGTQGGELLVRQSAQGPVPSCRDGTRQSVTPSRSSSSKGLVSGNIRAALQCPRA